METSTTVFLVIVGVMIVGMIGGWVFNKFLDDIVSLYFLHKSKKSFEKDFIASVLHSQPSYEQMKEIAGTRSLTQELTLTIYCRHIREIRSGRNPELEPHLELIESYVKAFQKEQPFQDLPSDIRLHLERVRDQMDEKVTLVALTSHIRDLVNINNKENKKLKFYTVGGFFIGVLGISLAMVFYFLPPNASEKPQNDIKAPAVKLVGQ
jgi:hypothetical protein